MKKITYLLAGWKGDTSYTQLVPAAETGTRSPIEQRPEPCTTSALNTSLHQFH